jgi:hypothetical protein
MIQKSPNPETGDLGARKVSDRDKRDLPNQTAPTSLQRKQDEIWFRCCLVYVLEQLEEHRPPRRRAEAQDWLDFHGITEAQAKLILKQKRRHRK